MSHEAGDNSNNGAQVRRGQDETDWDPQLQTLRSSGTADTVTIPRSVFEGMYLNPPVPMKNRMRKTLGNPTP